MSPLLQNRPKWQQEIFETLTIEEKAAAFDLWFGEVEIAFKHTKADGRGMQVSYDGLRLSISQCIRLVRDVAFWISHLRNRKL